MESLNIPLNKCCEIGDKIKELSNQIKELRIEYKDIEAMILNKMEETNIDVYNFNSKCTFKRKKRVSKTGLNKDIVSQGISVMFKDPNYNNCKTDKDKAQFGAEIIMNSREEKEVYVLERKSIK